MSKVRCWMFGVLAALLASGALRAADDRTIYTRADVAVAVTGEASLRSAYTQRLKLPWPDCAGDAFKCARDELYGQVYEVTFILRTVERAPDGGTTLERLDRGRVFIAAEFPVEIERVFEDTLVDYLRTLAVAAYARPQAGARFLRGPLQQQVLRQSGLPTWLCFELDGAYKFDLIVPGEGGERTFGQGGDTAATACREIAAAVEDVLPDIYSTMPDVRSQIRREVRLAEASTLGGLTWADRLAPIPEGATFEKQPLVEDRKTGAIWDNRDGFFIGHEGRYGTAERDVRLPAASLDIAGAPMWATRWTFDTVHETFGDVPRVDREPSGSIVIAVLPIADPLMEELERPRTPLHVPQRALTDRTTELLQGGAMLGSDIVRGTFSSKEAWPTNGDWMIVECNDDGTARYGIAPFGPAAEVRNPRETCAAVALVIGN